MTPRNQLLHGQQTRPLGVSPLMSERFSAESQSEIVSLSRLDHRTSTNLFSFREYVKERMTPLVNEPLEVSKFLTTEEVKEGFDTLVMLH